MDNIRKIVEAGRGFACSIYRTQPGALIPNPISDLLKTVWDGICADDPAGLPPAPTPPFTGGQCQCRSYRITHVITWNDGTSWTNTSDVWGAVLGIRCKPGDPNNRCQPVVSCRGFVFQGGCQLPGEYSVSSYSNGNPAGAPPRIRITSAVPVDGQVDNCGSLPASYPPSPPPPVGGYTSTPIKITYNDGTDFTTIFNLQPPQPTDVVPFPPICLTTKLGGKDVEVCLLPDGSFRVGGGVDEDGLLRELQDELREFREQYDRDNNPLPPDEDPSLTPQPLDGDGGGEEDAEGIQWLLVTLTEFPEKSQFGNPTVFWAGWVTFRVNGAYTERQQISYERSLFKAPDGADGYGVTFTNHSKGDVVSYVTQQSQEG